MSQSISNALTDLVVSKGFAARVIARAEELLTSPEEGEISAVIARETGQRENIIDAIITRYAVAQSRARLTLETAVRGGLDAAAETAEDIEDEPLRVPIRRKPMASIRTRQAAEAAC